MSNGIPSGLKLTFLAHGIAGTVLGLLYLLAPTWWGRLVGWPPAEPYDHRVIGTAFLAFALAALMAARQSDWPAVRIVAWMGLFWSCLAALLALWGVVAGGLPALGWLSVALVAGLAVAYLVFTTRARTAAT